MFIRNRRDACDRDFACGIWHERGVRASHEHEKERVMLSVDTLRVALPRRS